MNTVHIFTSNTLDGKMASSLMYEFYKRYKRDKYDKYFVYVINNLDIKANLNKGDTLVFLGKIFEFSEFMEKAIYDDYHVIFINSHNAIDIVKTDTCALGTTYDKFKNFEYELSCSSNSLSHMVYARNYKNIYIGGNSALSLEIPRCISLIDDYVNLKRQNENYLIQKKFIYGLQATKFNGKNLISMVTMHNSKLDIYKYHDNSVKAAEDKFINKIMEKGSVIQEYLKIQNNNLRDEFGFEFTIKDIDGLNINGYAVNTTNDISAVFEKVPDKCKILCTFYKAADGIWNYDIVLITDEYNINCGYIAKIFGDKKLDMGISIKNDYKAHFQTNKCIFDTCNVFHITYNIFTHKYGFRKVH